MDCFKVEKCSMVRRVQIWHSCWKSPTPCPPRTEDGDLPACYQHSVQKPASLMVWGCISAYGMGSLHVLEGTMNAERYIKVLEQHMLPSRRLLFQGRPWVFQQDNVKPHTAAITTAWVQVSPGAELACLQSISFTYIEHLADHSADHQYFKDDHKLFSSWKPI